jgi:hypothetical protein
MVGLDAGEGDRWVGINLLSRGPPVLYRLRSSLLQRNEGAGFGMDGELGMAYWRRFI